ncbi:hypothetical protein H0E87_026368 [Populus deltoides]|uniref:Band 7 domain-containing protein n=1 Tax=Populus deltoides TaxID=3696 RepID=A0A8T2X4U9_POPDE|nr:hypothetical protein H0E87_026368 [Populus deltoides]
MWRRSSSTSISLINHGVRAFHHHLCSLSATTTPRTFLSSSNSPLFHPPSSHLAHNNRLSVRFLRTGRDPFTRCLHHYLFYYFGFNLFIVDPKLASYGVENPTYAVVQLAQTTMRSELGKITLDKTFEERDTLNEKIVEAINVAATDWGLRCLRYEIRDISPPRGVKQAMEMQAEAERRKRAQILDSEGKRQADINIADGHKSAEILASQGEAEAILAKAQATAKGIAIVSEYIKKSGGVEAASLKIAEQYVGAFGNIAKEGTTILLPSATGNPANIMAQAFTMYKSLLGNVSNSGRNGSSSLAESTSAESMDSTTVLADNASSFAIKSTGESARDNGEPGFSLQSREKGKAE